MGFSFKILLRKKANSEIDESHIVCRIIINRIVKFYFLKFSIKNSDWSIKYQKLNSTDINAEGKNSILNDWNKRLNQINYEYKKFDNNFTLFFSS